MLWCYQLVGADTKLITLSFVFCCWFTCCGFIVLYNSCFHLDCRMACASWMICFAELVVLCVFTVLQTVIAIVAYATDC